ncbi:MAG: WYL domain-containing protein [Hymenobacter sp.]|nr:MAG: WYL domain-containing protein [Hymenobacter sp.]
MPVVKTPSLRFRLIDACLQRRQVRWTAALLLKKVSDDFFQATGRTFSKSQFNLDLKALREEYNAPLVYSRDQGYYYDEPNFSLFKSPLVSDDAAVLRQVLGLLQQFEGLGLGDELHELTQRVEEHLQAQAEAEPARQFIWFEQVPNYIGSHFLGSLYQAIQKQQVLEMQYRPFGAAQPLDIIVHPYLLKQYNHRWFLIGHGTGRPGLSTYALDRIEQLVLCNNQAYLSLSDDITSRFTNIVGVSLPSEDCIPELVQLRFSSSRGQYVRTKPLHPTQQLEAETSGALKVVLNVIPTQELVTLLLSFGDDVEVIEPLSLRQQIAERLRAAAKQYV